MAAMARSGAIKPIEFVSKTVNADYAYSWKALGAVDGKLTGLFFKATNRSAFWYDVNAFKRLGLSAPTTWKQFENVVATIKAHGLSPFAISGSSDVALPNLFQNVYLAFQGNHLYDGLAAGKLSWHDSSVTGSLGVLRSTFGNTILGGPAALGKSYAQAVKDVFGSPMRAYMVPGGSAAIPVLSASNAVRPLSQFGVFAFPRLNAKTAPQVIGDADAVVMAKDSEAARALVSYLATPDAAAIWAKRGGDFLSPNRLVGAELVRDPADGPACCSAHLRQHVPLPDRRPEGGAVQGEDEPGAPPVLPAHGHRRRRRVTAGARLGREAVDETGDSAWVGGSPAGAPAKHRTLSSELPSDRRSEMHYRAPSWFDRKITNLGGLTRLGLSFAGSRILEVRAASRVGCAEPRQPSHSQWQSVSGRSARTHPVGAQFARGRTGGGHWYWADAANASWLSSWTTARRNRSYAPTRNGNGRSAGSSTESAAILSMHRRVCPSCPDHPVFKIVGVS